MPVERHSVPDLTMISINELTLPERPSPRLAQSNRRADPHHLSRSIQAQRSVVQRPLIVHADQRWTSDIERPRQLFSRLAAHHPVLFVEEPVQGALHSAELKLSEPHPNIVRAVPILPYDARGPGDSRRAGVAALLRDRLLTDPSLLERFLGAIQWFCSPLDAPAFIGRFGTIGVVYDQTSGLLVRKQAADEKSGREHRERERRLLREAVVVFTEDSQAATGGRARCGSSAAVDEARARRIVWDAMAMTVRGRLLKAFPPRRTNVLPPRFLAASMVSFDLV